MLLLILFIQIYLHTLFIVLQVFHIICCFRMITVIFYGCFLSKINLIYSLIFSVSMPMSKLNLASLSRLYNVIMVGNMIMSNSLCFLKPIGWYNVVLVLIPLPKNGKAERMIRNINNICRSLLFHVSLPPSYWIESLDMAAYLLNIHPTPLLDNLTPMHILFNKAPSYDHLRMFGCLCYQNLSIIEGIAVLILPLTKSLYLAISSLMKLHSLIPSSQYTPKPSDFEFLDVESSPNSYPLSSFLL